MTGDLKLQRGDTYGTNKYKDAEAELKKHPYTKRIVGRSPGGSVALELAHNYKNDDGEELLNEFHQKYVNDTSMCYTENSELLREARLSFLSGHASYSFYFATFLIHFMSDHRKHLKWGSKIVPFIKLLVIMLASWISLTRINDFYHHPFDIFCGAFTGIAVAFHYKGNKNTTSSRDQAVGEELSEAQHMKTTT